MILVGDCWHKIATDSLLPLAACDQAQAHAAAEAHDPPWYFRLANLDG
jgi:hypothetical protein